MFSGRRRVALQVTPLSRLAQVKNPNAPAVKREAEEDWGGDMRAQPLFLKGPKLSQIKRDHA